MNIVIFPYTHPQLKRIAAYMPKHIEQIHSVVPQANIHIINATSSQDLLPEADVVIIPPSHLGGFVDFTKAPRLKWVHLTSAGASEVAQKLNGTDILLTNSSGVHPIPIAEHVCSYMLMFARRMNVAYTSQLQRRTWVQDGLFEGLGELYQSTVGIVGFGRIGQRIAHIAKAFDMRVVVLTRSPETSNFTCVDVVYCGHDGLKQLLQASDFVVNCLPLTEETNDFFNHDSFRHMKPTAYFINIGRGKTVVESDLIDALARGTIAGAGLDVFEDEPLPETSVLWRLGNVILTPHYAGWTPRYIDRVVDIFCANLKQYLTNGVMPTLVDKSKGY